MILGILSRTLLSILKLSRERFDIGFGIAHHLSTGIWQSLAAMQCTVVNNDVFDVLTSENMENVQICNYSCFFKSQM